MNDNDVQSHIESLVKAEHELYERADEKPLSTQDRNRLEDIQVQLDRYYDLLRQRRAKREFGRNPDAAQMRSEQTVEGYVE